jgi:hypothetical protein
MTRFLYASTLAVCPGASFGEEDLQPETGEKGFAGKLALGNPDGPRSEDSRPVRIRLARLAGGDGHPGVASERAATFCIALQAAYRDIESWRGRA